MGRQSRLGGSFSYFESLADELLPLLEGFALRQVVMRERDMEVPLFEIRIFKSGEEFMRFGGDEKFAVGDKGNYAIFGGVNAIGIPGAFEYLLDVELAGFLHLGPASGHPVGTTSF